MIATSRGKPIFFLKKSARQKRFSLHRYCHVLSRLLHVSFYYWRLLLSNTFHNASSRNFFQSSANSVLRVALRAALLLLLLSFFLSFFFLSSFFLLLLLLLLLPCTFTYSRGKCVHQFPPHPSCQVEKHPDVQSSKFGARMLVDSAILPPASSGAAPGVAQALAPPAPAWGAPASRPWRTTRPRLCCRPSPSCPRVRSGLTYQGR